MNTLKKRKKPQESSSEDRLKLVKEVVGKSKFGSSLKHKIKSYPTHNYDVGENKLKEVAEKYEESTLKRSGSAEHLKLDHLFSKNIYSERQRIDPRELDSIRSNSGDEEESEEYEFPDSDESESDDKNKESKVNPFFPRIDTVQEMDYEETLEDTIPQTSNNIIFEEDSDSENYSVDAPEPIIQQVLSCRIQRNVLNEKRFVSHQDKRLKFREKARSYPSKDFKSKGLAIKTNQT